MIGVAFGIAIETLSKRFELKRVPSDERVFEGVDGVSNAVVVSTVRSLADAAYPVVCVYFDEDPIPAMVYVNDFGFYVCNF